MTKRNPISILKAAICVAALLLGTAPNAQTTVNLTLDQARQIAVTALLEGDVRSALQLADGLLGANADDRDAWVIRSGALRQLGEFKLARQAAAKAYRLSSTAPERHQAARLAAVSNAEEKRFSWAQFWLRLARENAPSAEAANQIAVEYRRLRQLNPWSFSASVGVAPSGNINGGSQGDTAYLEDSVSQVLADFLEGFGVYDPSTGLRLLGDNERALSGTEASLSFGAQYRLANSATSATFASMNVSMSRYRLSSEAQESSPTSENSDFDRDQLSFGLRHLRVLSEDMRPATFSLGVGKSWYGGDPSNRYVTASVSQPFLISPNELLTLGVNASASKSYSNDIPVRAIGASARLLTVLPSGNRLGSSVSVSKSRSDIEDSDFTSLSVGVNYSFAKPIAGLGVSLTTNATYSDIGDTRFAPFDREDTTVSVGANISVPRAEIFGFQPVISFGASKTESNVNQFDSTTLNFGVDFQSSF